MKKILKVILAVFLAIVVAGAVAVTAFVCTNFELAKGAFELLLSAPGNNFKAAWIFITNDSEEIGQKMDDNTQKYGEAVTEVIDGLADEGVSISPEVLAALESGNYTEEEMARIIASGGTELEAINREKEAAASVNVPDTSDTPSTETIGENAENVENSEKTETSVSGDKVTETQPAVPVVQQPAVEPEKKDPAPQVPSTEPVTQPEKSPEPANPPADSETAETNPAPSTETQTPQETPPTEQPQPEQTQSTVDDAATSIAKLYVVKSRFVSELASLEKTIRRAYSSLPMEQQVPASRKSIAGQYIRQVADLELECDAEVEEILAELTTKLEAQGKDTAVVQTLRAAYENEKSLKKAYYIDVYMNGI